MLSILRHAGVRGLVLAGYLLAWLMAGVCHDHGHTHTCEGHRHGGNETTHRNCGHHHHSCGHRHEAPAASKDCCPDSPEPCEGECAACKFLAQCPLPVALIDFEQVSFSRPRPPLACERLLGARLSAEHPGRGPPA